MSLEHRLATELGRLGLPPCRLVLGVSGGPDSLALLHLMDQVALPLGFELVVAHADHRLHPDSQAVAALVARCAESLALPVVIGQLDLAPGAGESEARTARHAWLERVRIDQGATYLVLGHQRDDQAETVLMRVLAGSGPAGLAAMAAVQGTVVRPLLAFSRRELADHVAAIGWRPWDDPANTDPRHTRSWLRSVVLPQVAARDPAVADRLVGAAAQAATGRQAWDAVLDLLPGLAPTAEPEGVSFAAAPLMGYHSGLAQTLIQAAGRRAGAVVGPAAAGRVLAMIQAGRSGAWVPLGGGWRAELAFGRVRIVPDAPPSGFPAREVGREAAGVAACGPRRLRWSRELAPEWIPRDGWTSWFIPGAYTLRAWTAGDQLRPLGGVGRRLAVRCLQDARVPRTDRATWPVLTAADHGPLVWIPGICRAEEALPRPGSEALRIDVEPG